MANRFRPSCAPPGRRGLRAARRYRLVLRTGRITPGRPVTPGQCANGRRPCIESSPPAAMEATGTRGAGRAAHGNAECRMPKEEGRRKALRHPGRWGEADVPPGHDSFRVGHCWQMSGMPSRRHDENCCKSCCYMGLMLKAGMALRRPDKTGHTRHSPRGRPFFVPVSAFLQSPTQKAIQIDRTSPPCLPMQLANGNPQWKIGNPQSEIPLPRLTLPPPSVHFCPVVPTDGPPVFPVPDTHKKE